MTVGSGFLVDGRPQVQGIDDSLGPEIEVFSHQLHDLRIRQLAGAEGVDGDGDRLGDPDDVRELYLTTPGSPAATTFLAT